MLRLTAIGILVCLPVLCGAGGVGERAPARPRIGVLNQSTPGAKAESVAVLVAALQRGEPAVEVVTLDVDQVARLTSDGAAKLDAIVVPDATNAPESLTGVLERQARAGRAIVLIGPEPLAKAGKADPLELRCSARDAPPRPAKRLRSPVGTGLGPPAVSLATECEVAPVFGVPRDGQSALVPLLVADGEDPAAAMPTVAAALMNHYAGRHAGSRWLLVGLTADAVAERAELTGWLAGATAALANPEPLRLPASATGPANELSKRIGVTTAFPGYRFAADQDDLDEGAARIRELGSRTIKLWFWKLKEAYPHTQWPTDMKNMVDVARSPAFEKVFRDDGFDTYVLEAFGVGMDAAYWRYRSHPQKMAEDEQQFYDLTRHLLTTYRGTGKTFILQDWEGDWAARGKFDAKITVDEAVYDRMVEWLNARQRGVDRARAEAGDVSGVRVLHAAEVNQVRTSLRGEGVNVIDAVIPKTNVDLVSYSCYEAQNDPRLLRACLEHIASKLKPKAGVEGCRVFVGEFGAAENGRGGLERVQRVLPETVDVSLAFGCPYVVYWQLYCNEPIRKPVQKNEDTKGLWLIKPDGTKAWAWDYLHKRIATTKVGK
jgi:hypothetical protein